MTPEIIGYIVIGIAFLCFVFIGIPAIWKDIKFICEFWEEL